MQVLHLVPLIGCLVKHVCAISSFTGLAVVNDVGDQVVASFLVFFFILGCENVAEVNVPNRD